MYDYRYGLATFKIKFTASDFCRRLLIESKTSHPLPLIFSFLHGVDILQICSYVNKRWYCAAWSPSLWRLMAEAVSEKHTMESTRKDCEKKMSQFLASARKEGLSFCRVTEEASAPVINITNVEMSFNDTQTALWRFVYALSVYKVCLECKRSGIKMRYTKLLRRAICHECRKTPKYEMISDEMALLDFGISSVELNLFKVEGLRVPDPMNRKQILVYYRSDIERVKKFKESAAFGDRVQSQRTHKAPKKKREPKVKAPKQKAESPAQHNDKVLEINEVPLTPKPVKLEKKPRKKNVEVSEGKTPSKRGREKTCDPLAEEAAVEERRQTLMKVMQEGGVTDLKWLEYYFNSPEHWAHKFIQGTTRRTLETVSNNLFAKYKNKDKKKNKHEEIYENDEPDLPVFNKRKKISFTEDQMELRKDELIERLTMMHLDITQVNFEDPDSLANAYVTGRTTMELGPVAGAIWRENKPTFTGISGKTTKRKQDL